MGNSGIHPNDNIIFNHGVYTPVSYRQSYDYPMYTSRGFQQPYSPMINGFQHGIFNNQVDGRGFYNSPYTTSGSLQSTPLSARPNGHIQLHRPGEYRPHFD
ncbi:unnamed protein product [Rotaria sordida]|uniref:Uncharacterized protein n=1 Tax=Rotaria sordida TaxID=392033 RepID=A0A819HZD7_9BILA|nr:unnamed protein product [Rotaria sordida]CAF3854842.1 unnamed protein product [Rotaria sordida]CAF3908787.1 unnamed protein product [Rotaria sordida]